MFIFNLSLSMLLFSSLFAVVFTYFMCFCEPTRKIPRQKARSKNHKRLDHWAYLTKADSFKVPKKLTWINAKGGLHLHLPPTRSSLFHCWDLYLYIFSIQSRSRFDGTPQPHCHKRWQLQQSSRQIRRCVNNLAAHVCLGLWQIPKHVSGDFPLLWCQPDTSDTDAGPRGTGAEQDVACQAGNIWK